MPMIRDKASLLSELMVGKIYGADGKTGFSIGSMLKENVPINLPWMRLFNSHLGIFGNTGSGKSNTLAKLYTTLFNERLQALQHKSQLFSGEAFKLMLKETLEQQWMIKPGDLEKNPKKIDGLYDKIEKQIINMENILKTSGVVNPKAEALADNIRGNIEFMNQINEAYTYMQVPLRMNEGNASGQLYVYTNKKSISLPDKELLTRKMT